MTSTDNLCQDRNRDYESPSLCHVCYLNKGEADEMEISGYRRGTLRTIVTWSGIILSFGILRLIFHWYQQWMVYCTHTRCPLKFAHHVVVIDRYLGTHKTFYVKPVKRMNLEDLCLEDLAVVSNDLNVTNLTRLTNEAGPIVRIHFSDGSFVDENELIEIKVKKLTYLWRDDLKAFCKVAGIDKGLQKSDYHNFSGFSFETQLMKRLIYGKNEICVKISSYWELCILECLNPFYIFQLLSLIIWFVGDYIYYCFAIIAMSLFGILSTVFQIRQNQKQLAETVQAHGMVTVCRSIGKTKYDAQYEEIHISNLVPGDVIVIPRSGFIVPCDAVLLSGHCIVNESMLTGESVPVTKTALPCVNSPYAEPDDSSHTLYCGTQVLQARYYANELIYAVVLRTGFLTARGNLVRSILYPLPHDFQFDQDVNKFVRILAVVAIAGVLYSFYTKLKNNNELFTAIIDSLDIVTIVVPPALPAALSVGKYYAQNRLQKQKISCMNASVINVSGSVNCVCFDKTGTLTEDGLDMYGVIPTNNQLLGPLVTDVKDCSFLQLREAMASCHSLTFINGVLCGDPLDVKMFEFTGWILDESDLSDTVKFDLLPPTIVKSDTDDHEIGIIHQFQFSSRLQRMSVITRHLGSKELTVYCKGSPEMITSLSNSKSVPQDLDSVLEKQTQKGYRVIAVGYRTFPAIDIIKLKKLQRNEVECDLTFAGLIIFENKLKEQTSSVINDLQKAKMKIVMLTGDNIQTAICVARECGMIFSDETIVNVNMSKNNGHTQPHIWYSENKGETQEYIPGKATIFSISDIELGPVLHHNHKYALTGQVWSAIREFYPQSTKDILEKGVVFARMSSDQKQQVIQELQALGYYVAMCGDGANDCGALKTADVGISLSEAESSVASPFTSHQPDISCVPKVIKEGRTALVTAFGLFKFMVLYSLMEFFSSVLLFTFNSELSDLEFLYIDVGLIVVFAFFFGQTKPYGGKLVPNAPSSSLISLTQLVSFGLQLGLMCTTQILAVVLVSRFHWFERQNPNHPTISATFENYAVYTVSQFQYIALAVTFSYGRPYREPFFRNAKFFVSLLIMTAVSVFITVDPFAVVAPVLEFRLPPSLDFRFVVLSLAVITFVFSVTLESLVTNYLARKLTQCVQRKTYVGSRPSKGSTEFLKSSIDHLSSHQVKCYGTMV